MKHFGFFFVFSVVMFSDNARTKDGYLYLAGFGLMFGIIGDAAGNLTGVVLNGRPLPLVIVASTCFVVTFVVFFLLYNKF